MSSETAIHRNWTKFSRMWKLPPAAVAFAPGRVNLIGDHTDYNGGLALPAPVNRWVYVGARRTNLENGPGFRIHAENMNATAEWRMGMAAPEESWMRFAQGAYETWAKKSGQKKSFDLYVQGDVPQGAGLSSSAALGIALLKSIAAADNGSLEGMELCEMAQQIEHDYLGVETGLLDQMAVVFGKKDRLLEIDFQSGDRIYHKPPPLEVKWVVIDSGVRRALTDSGYQQRVEETREAFKHIQKDIPGISHFRDITVAQLDDWITPSDGLFGAGEAATRAGGLLPGYKYNKQVLYQRMKHFATENERVQAFIARLLAGDTWGAGDLLDQSHQSLRDDYASSCPEIDFLQSEAIKTKGCLGSRIMGGGFGGCTINMVVPSRTETFLADLLARYKAQTGLEGRGFIFDWSDGAGVHP